METKSKREIAREDYHKLLDKIAAARNLCYKKGLMSTEVWLGPKQREILISNWLCEEEERRFVFSEFPRLETIETLMLKLKGSSVYGLKIRFSEEDGVWAGITFQNEDKKD